MSEQTTEELLVAARGGDQSALMQVLFRFHDPLLKHIQINIGEKLSKSIEADDILQETFVAAMRGIGKQRQNAEAAFLAWLKSIASNRIRDAARNVATKKRGGDRLRVDAKPDPFRSRAGNLLEELNKDSRTPSRVAASTEAISAMQVALATIPEEQREAIRLHCLDGLSLEETAELLGRSTGSVRGLIQRAKEKLRNQMDRASKWMSG
jgi:RNA polymerase sigma-70 factor (ECF subfamily)